MGSIQVHLQKMRRWLKLDLIRELGRQYPLLCFLLLVLLLSTVLLNRYIHIIMGLWSFLAGMVTFYCLLGPEALLPNFAVSIKPKIKSYQQEALFPLGHSCAVCGKTKCKRHRPSLLLEKYQPWFDLKVPSKVDASLSEILELVLENFVYRWYRKKTDDEAFIDELRVTLRFVAAVLVRRALKVDLASLITEKLLKVATKHIEITIKARQKVKSVEYLQQAALGEYGPDLHVALHSRRDELLYLRKLTELMFQYILPPKASDCRSLTSLLREVLTGSVFLPSMDYLADPDTANRLILLFFNNSNSQPEEATKPTSALVPFLQMFSDARYENHSALKLDLKEIREQQDLLFRFMNFLKQEGAVHVLQFYLTVEEFNVKILCPEMTDSEKQLLHEEVKKIYETYCLEESVDKIRFDPVVVQEIRNIAQGPCEEVMNLQTMACLCEAQEHVLSLLETVFIPMFCDSDEYFHQLLRPAAVSPAKNCRVSRSRRGESSRVSRIGSKIKGVFKSTTTMEGTMLPSSGLVEEEDNMAEEAMMVLEDDFPDPVDEACGLGSAPRDLSAWSVTIPCICDDDDDAKNEQVPVFCLIVERNDRKAAVGHKAENWCVYRRYTEFYVLESKLTEFHGPFPDAQLPSKRIIGPKNYEFLSSKREEFQEYLQNLLQHPELSNSQLLADFLSPHMESQFRTKRLPDVNLGKIFKAVPSKLTIEKGQHLEPFIKSFRNSCKSPKPKPNSPELTVLSPTSGIDKRLSNELFKNNANLSDTAEKRHNQNCFVEMITVEGVYDYLMHIGRVVFHIPDWLHHLLMGGRILFKNTFEAYADHCLQAKLDRVAQEYRLVSLITLLRDAVFREHSQPRSTADIEKRAKRTFEEMLSYIPDLLEKCIGEEAKYEGVRLLFDGLQQPVLNKQLTYVLLDIVIQELFPELNKVK